MLRRHPAPLTIRSDFSDDPPFRELLVRIREATLGAYVHQDLPFEKVVEALAPERSAQGQMLFQAFLVFHNAPMPALELPGLVLSPLEIEVGRRSPFFDLTLGFSEAGEHLAAGVEYDGSLFESATMDRLIDHFRRLMEAIVADPDCRVGDLTLMSEAHQKEEAIELLGRLVDSSPRLNHRLLYAHYLMQDGLKDKAREQIEEGLIEYRQAPPFLKPGRRRGCSSSFWPD